MLCQFAAWVTMSPIEKNLFHLAERLHMGVWQLKQMPVSEYFGWVKYINEQSEERDRSERAAKGDLTAMTPQQIISRMT